MSAGPQLSSFLRPMSKLPPVGGACQWGCTKTVPVLDASVTERADTTRNGRGGRSRLPILRMAEAAVRTVGLARTARPEYARRARVHHGTTRRREARPHRGQ